jgi:predicted O-linked N-acetylglucosamine transferase (SPINDLY family)
MAELTLQQAMDLAEQHLRAGGLSEAEQLYQQILSVAPDQPDALHLLGVSLIRLHRPEEALERIQKAIAIDANRAAFHSNLGVVLSDLNRNAEAIAAYQKALQLNPQYAEALYNMANSLRQIGEVEQAIQRYREALAIRPDPDTHDNLLYAMHLPAVNPAEIWREHQRWNELYAQPLAGEIQRLANDRNPDRRLRLGYVSPDFHQHSVAFFIEPLWAHHDAKQIEIFAYNDSPKNDAMTQRLEKLAHHWRNVRLRGHAELAQQIRDDRIDILVDLAGHTAANRLLVFARKPAPIQISYCGYPDTTGLRAMDYRITDAQADPPGLTEALHSEKLIRLPRTFLCYRPVADTPAPGASRRTGERIIFGSFNSLAKISLPTIALWAEILKKVPGSGLVIKNHGLADPTAREILPRRFAECGIAADRLELVVAISLHNEHLAFYDRIDIALDTFPYNGTATTCEALWMGVPVLTLGGPTHESRVGASLLHNLRLDAWIAGDTKEYVQLAAKYAADRSGLARLHADLRGRMSRSALMNESQFARDMEAACRHVWRIWCRG